MGKIEIFNQLDEEIKELETVEKVLMSAIDKEKLNDVTFNLIIVNNEYIHELNKNYRGIDRETDVITFALENLLCDTLQYFISNICKSKQIF